MTVVSAIKLVPDLNFKRRVYFIIVFVIYNTIIKLTRTNINGKILFQQYSKINV